MPICEADPWRKQYFENIPCPADINIPTEDHDAWEWYPRHRWIYNKLAIADSQKIPCGPHGHAPVSYPVFSKPIYNLRGMGMGSQAFHSAAEYHQAYAPGHMWVEFLSGEHVSSDVAIVRGKPVWWRHVTGHAMAGGTFDYWTISEQNQPELEAYCGAWIEKHLPDYTGMLNLETIGGKIIEAHLRFADQWPDLYGKGWVEALIRLYSHGVWEYDDKERRDGYSVILFGNHGRNYRHPPARKIDALRQEPEISSIQITFHEDRHAASHAMPPGGFRLAVLNCWDLQAGLAAREKMAQHFK